MNTKDRETGTSIDIEQWLTRLDAQTTFSASEVQSRLFDLYGDLRDSPLVESVKPWLLLTRTRELFSADELADFLRELAVEAERQNIPAEESTA